MPNFKLFLLLFLTSCLTLEKKIEIKDVPIYKKAMDKNGYVFCNAEIKILSEEKRCVPDKEFKEEIEPTALIISADTFFYFRSLILKMCSFANYNKKISCNKKVKNFDSAIESLLGF